MGDMQFTVSNEKCGFFDIDCRNEFRVINSGEDLVGVIGIKAEGTSYPELVFPDDREDVCLHLKAAENGGTGCIRHRIRLHDNSMIYVSLGFRYSNGLLNAVISRVHDVFMGDAEKYKSNHTLESIAVSIAIVYVNDNGGIFMKYANDDFYRMIGWNRLEFKEYFNESLQDVIFIADAPYFFEKMRGLGIENSDMVLEVRTVSSNGRVRWNEIHSRFLLRENDKNIISLVFGDITDLKRLQNELISQNERFKIIQTSSDQMIFDYYTESDTMVFNGDIGSMNELLRLNDVEVNVNKNELVIHDYFKSGCVRGFVDDEDYQLHTESFAAAIISGKCSPFDFVLTADDEARPWCRCIYSAVKNDQGETVRIVGRFKNIDKQKKNELLMEKRMHCDFLTGLLNKETAISRICDFLKDSDVEGKLHALMIIDIDNFRMVNDRLGHSFGDSVIQEFASDIKSSFRDTDIVGRIGGDEFLILMKNVTLKSASKKASRLCRGLVRNYSVQQQNISLSCSIGISFYGKDSEAFEDLYKYADIAMYNAKVNGRCSYRIYDSENVEMQTEISETQNRTAMDPPSGVTDPGELDTNLLDVAFSLMAASEDIFGTIDILIRTVGRKYNLSSVTLLLYDDKINGYEVKNEWFCGKHSGHSGTLSSYECDNTFENTFCSGDLKCVTDVSSSELPPAIKNNMKNNDVRAFVIGRLEGRGSAKYGYIVFVQRERRRKWSRKETNTFKYITKIISVALADRYFNSSESECETE